MDDPDRDELPASALTWESASRPLAGAIVDRDGAVYMRMLKLDATPAMLSSTPEQRRAMADFVMLRLIAALSADTTEIEVFRQSPTAKPERPDDWAATLRDTMRLIHAKASAAAKEGHLLQLSVDDELRSITSLNADGISDRPLAVDTLGPIKTRKKRISPLIEPLLQLFPNLSAEDIEIDDECTVRAPLRGLKHLIPDDLPPGEQLDRLDILIDMYARNWAENGVRFSVGGRPDVFDGWLRMEFPESEDEMETDSGSEQSDRKG
ncbi:MAG: hypothetical protein WD715_11665 [Dongiaceae bacterium]